MKIIAIIICLYLMNIGSYLYIHKTYVKSLKRCRKYGRVSTGRKKGYIKGSIALLVYKENDDKIVYGEILQGSTVFCKFKRFDEIIGMTIDEAEDKYKDIKGYDSVIQAIGFIKEDFQEKLKEDNNSKLVIDC